MKKTLVLGLLFAVALVLPLASAANVDVRFTVMNAYGDQIAGAAIDIQNSTDSVCNHTTNSEGQVDCSIEADNDYMIIVSHDNYQSIDDDVTLTAFSNDWNNIGIVLRPKKVHLNITVAETGTGIADAKITISVNNDSYDFGSFIPYDKMVFPDGEDHYALFEIPDGEATTYTDENGIDILSGLEAYPTEYELTVEKEGYASGDVPQGCIRISFYEDFNDSYCDNCAWPGAWMGGPGPACLHYQLERPNMMVQLTQLENITYKATVYDMDTNQLIENASVQIVSITSDRQWTGQTGTDGKARFRITVPDCFNITVSKDGYRGDTGQSQCLNSNSRYDTFWLMKGMKGGEASVTVVVYDRGTNELIKDASVVIANNEPGGITQTEITDSNGEALFTVNTPACYDITASKDSYDSDTAEDQCFEANDVVNLPLFLTQNSSEHEVWNNTITLVAGVWKLISVPYELTDNDVNSVFPLKIPIGTGDDWVLHYNGTDWENPAMTIDPLKGYWVKSDTNATITPEYEPKSPDDLFPEIELKQGWNMIGHTEDKAQPIEAALYSLYDNGQPMFEIVYRWDGSSWEKYIPGVLAEFNELYPGEGYWIKMKEDWTYTAIDMNTIV
jgi:hypothetical protein